MKPLNLARILAAALLGAGTVAYAQPVDRAELEALRAQIRQLEQQVNVLARQLEIKEEAAAAAAPSTPKVSVTDKGVSIASADGANTIKFRGLIQADSRVFFGDNGIANNSFVLRRARLITEGTFAKSFGYQFVTEFGGSSVSILDANITTALGGGVQFKAGKFKVPVGLELLQSDSWTFFNERSLVTNLVPNRDVGVQLSGDLLSGRANVALGAFGGVADAGSSTNADFDNDKDVAGRVFISPFKNDAGSALQGLSFGVGGSLGRQKTASGRASGYRTDGQQVFFTYSPGVVADGQVWRVSPQFDYRNGSFGVLGEYAVSAVNVRAPATGVKQELQNKAWQLAAGYVLTGEDSSPSGVAPKADFNWSAGTWGAFEAAVRYAVLQIDDTAFPTFASASSSADEAKSVGVGLNWYLSKTVRFTFDYYQTRFGLNALAPAAPSNAVLRQDEKAFVTRFQLSF